MLAMSMEPERRLHIRLPQHILYRFGSTFLVGPGLRTPKSCGKVLPILGTA
jgi:hypothetical protein